MPRKKSEGKRYFVKLSEETKRKLDFLAVDAGAGSTEEYAGRLLTTTIDQMWQNFDPKRTSRPRPPIRS